MTADEQKKCLDDAEKGPRKLAAAVLGLSDNVLHYKVAPDKWCILEIIGHLADAELVYGYRLRQMLADKEPVIAPIDQEDWARNLGYLEAAPAELVAQYGLNRHHNLRLLRKSGVNDLGKAAYHPERKANMTVEELVRGLAAHDASHLAQIERLKQQASKK